MTRTNTSPMPRNAHVVEHLYTGMSRADLHQAALARIEHYSGTPPDPDLASTWAMLKSAWAWVAERFAP